MRKLSRLILLSLALLLLLAVSSLQRPFEPAEAQTSQYVYLPLIYGPVLNPKKGAFVTHGVCQDTSLLRASWYFTNDVQPPAGCPQPDPRFVPTIQNAEAMAQLSTAISNAQVSGWLKGFIEPNLPWQGHVDPDQAAELWRQIEIAADAAGGIKLASPSPSQHNPGWLKDMVIEYQARYGRKPRFDAIAWNYYYAPDDGFSDTVMEFLTKRHNDALAYGYDVPIWVMEYSGECWYAGKYNLEVMNTQTPMFNQTNWIGRYAWFASRIYGDEPWGPGWQSCSLVNPYTGTLNPLGELYAGY
jgi:hypothetical protein